MNHGARFGVLNEETGRYHLLTGDPLYSGLEQSGEVITADEAHFVAPMLPRSKVIGFHQPFGAARSEIHGNEILPNEISSNKVSSSEILRSEISAPELTAYLKPNTSVVGTNVPVVIPKWAPSAEISFTPQLGLIVSRPCKEVPSAMVGEMIFGYLLVAVGEIPELAAKDPARAYAFDTSCLSGPIVETGMPTGDFQFSFDLGADGYDASVKIDVEMLSNRIALASDIATLLPGDLILSGPLAKALTAREGDEIVFQNTGLGTLQNSVLK